MKREAIGDGRLLQVEARLARLERKYRLALAGTGLAVAMWVAAIALGAASPLPETIQARAFEVLDKDGNTVARLGHRFKGSGFLVILTREGKPVIRASALGDAGVLTVATAGGRVLFRAPRE